MLRPATPEEQQAFGAYAFVGAAGKVQPRASREAMAARARAKRTTRGRSRPVSEAPDGLVDEHLDPRS